MKAGSKILLAGLGVAGFALWLTRTQSGRGAAASLVEKGRKIVQTMSDAGMNYMEHIEGFSPVRYPDPKGQTVTWSIAFGHKIRPGEVFNEPMPIEQGRALLAADTAHAQSVVRALIKVPLTADQFDKLSSFVYNIGEGAFRAGTVPAKINAGNFAAAAATMLQYDKEHINGVLVRDPVLADRRAQEVVPFA